MSESPLPLPVTFRAPWWIVLPLVAFALAILGLASVSCWLIVVDPQRMGVVLKVIFGAIVALLLVAAWLVTDAAFARTVVDQAAVRLSRPLRPDRVIPRRDVVAFGVRELGADGGTYRASLSLRGSRRPIALAGLDPRIAGFRLGPIERTVRALQPWAADPR